MNDLPWLLVYGRVAWILAVALTAALACVVAWSRARRRGLASGHWGRRELARPASEQGLADGARTVVSGVVVAESRDLAGLDAPAPAAATTARAERTPDSLKDALDRSASVRAPSIALRCDDGAVVELDGPVAVLAGSREVWTGCALPMLPGAVRARVEASDEAGAAMLSNQHVVLASVCAGDRVQAFGRLVARQDIRTVAVRWSLAPAPEPSAAQGDAALAAIPVVYEGAARVAGPLRRALVRAALVGAVGAFATLSLVGEVARLASIGGVPGSATVLSREDQPLAFASVSSDLLAAATPFRRDEAVRRVARQVRRNPVGAREVRTVAAVWSLGSDCHVGVQLLAQRGRFDEAAAMGERCGDPAARWTASQVSMLAGDAARASRLIAPLHAPPEGYRGQEVFAALAHLYAGRFARSAEFLRRAADAEERPGGRVGPREEALRCGAAALDVGAGNEGARAQIQAHLGSTQGWRCALYRADLESGPARLATLRDARAQLGEPYGAWRTLDAMLRVEAGERVVDLDAMPGLPAGLLRNDPGEVLEARVFALERAAHEAYAAVPEGELSPAMRLARSRIAASRAAFEAVFGRPEDARRLIASALADLAPVLRRDDAAPGNAAIAASDSTRLTELGEVVDLRAGVAPSTHLGDAALPDFLAGASLPHATPWTERYDDEAHFTAWEALGAGDGAALAATLENSGNEDPFRDPGLAFGVRRLASGADAMRAWLAWGPRAPCWRCKARFAGYDLSHLAMAARALGLRDEAASAERQLAAMREVLLRRDAAVAAMLIESM